MILRNLLSQNQINQLKLFINETKAYLEHFNEVDADINSTRDGMFIYPLQGYNDFLKELYADRILNDVELISFCQTNTDEIQEIIFQPEIDELYFTLPIFDAFPLISENILDSKNYRRELLNFVQIESDKEIAISKAKFFEEIYSNENDEIYIHPDVA